jgi:hypothetical protein
MTWIVLLAFRAWSKCRRCVGRGVLRDHLLEREPHPEDPALEADAASDRAPRPLVEMKVHAAPAHAPRPPAHMRREPRVIVEVSEDASGGGP